MPPDRRSRRGDCAPDSPAPRSTPPAAAPHERVAPRCDPPAPAPSTPFVTPLPATVPIVRPAVPAALSVGNATQIARCSDVAEGPPVGGDVQVSAGQFSVALRWQDLELRDDQLQFISGLTEERRRVWLTGSVDVIRGALQLTAAQAIRAVALRTAAQALADEQARELAMSTLDCVWSSGEVSRECPTGALVGDGNPVVVAAGTFSSRISQSDADDQAAAFAESQLSCRFTNDLVVVTCQDLGFVEAVPNDPEVGYPGPARRVGSVSIAAGVVFSDVSQADANQLAYEQASSALVCQYFSQPVSINCAQQGKNGTADLGEADVVTNTPGSSVNIPAAFVVSTVSTAAATAEAQAVANSLLRCVWRNTEQSVVCPAQVLRIINGVFFPTEYTALPPADVPGEYLLYAPSISSPVGSVTVAQGTIESEVSQAAADAEALVAANAQLSCLYCNQTTLPNCAPASLAAQYGVPLPPAAYQSTPGLSLDVTQGVAAGTFCAPQAVDAQTIAISSATIPVGPLAKGDNCRYGNDVIRLPQPCQTLCSQYNPAGETFSPAGCLARVRAGGPALPIVVAANTVVVTSADVPAGFVGGAKAYANSQALGQAWALAAAICECGNAAVSLSITCGKGSHIPNPSNPNDISRKTASVAMGANQVFANTFKAATQLATGMLSIGTNCEADPAQDGDPGTDGKPGNDGAQTSCQGQCAAYYS